MVPKDHSADAMTLPTAPWLSVKMNSSGTTWRAFWSSGDHPGPKKPSKTMFLSSKIWKCEWLRSLKMLVLFVCPWCLLCSKQWWKSWMVKKSSELIHGFLTSFSKADDSCPHSGPAAPSHKKSHQTTSKKPWDWSDYLITLHVVMSATCRTLTLHVVMSATCRTLTLHSIILIGFFRDP